MSRESETLEIVETIREINFGKDKKPIENVQRPLVCTMELHEKSEELQAQMLIIANATIEIEQIQKRIRELTQIMNLDLNKYLKLNQEENGPSTTWW